MDPTSVIGLLLGVLAIVVGQIAEGGHLASLVQPTAALIVLGGTAGATVLSVTSRDLARGLGMLSSVFRRAPNQEARIVAQFTRLAESARKDGIVGIEAQVEKERDPFFRSVMRQVVDGTTTQLLQEILETALVVQEDRDRGAIKVYDTAGGYAPTMGIIGAVLGLIHVMENLDDASALGEGIAVAFVATIYGVGIANVVLFPIASRLKRLVARRLTCCEMVIEGAIAIQAGHGPRVVRDRLNAFLPQK